MTMEKNIPTTTQHADPVVVVAADTGYVQFVYASAVGIVLSGPGIQVPVKVDPALTRRKVWAMMNKNALPIANSDVVALLAGRVVYRRPLIRGSPSGKFVFCTNGPVNGGTGDRGYTTDAIYAGQGGSVKGTITPCLITIAADTFQIEVFDQDGGTYDYLMIVESSK